jgi:hypothetical protein
MRMQSIEFAQISNKKEILFRWAFVDNIALYPLKVGGLSREKKNLRQESKEKDSNLRDKKSSISSSKIHRNF